MGKVILNDIRVYAFHGCMDEEKKIGSEYIVRLEAETNMDMAAASDRLDYAVDYVTLNAIVKKEMSVRSKLLENVGKRIIDSILQSFPAVNLVSVSVSKQNPPIGGDVGEVSVQLKASR
ncbi:MAG: dihydroneopterin aldolase [Flavobacteriaceae bacterium]|nr:dihydroneopterin aldolase [Flavobacteriaceae bacterium]